MPVLWMKASLETGGRMGEERAAATAPLEQLKLSQRRRRSARSGPMASDPELPRFAGPSRHWPKVWQTRIGLQERAARKSAPWQHFQLEVLPRRGLTRSSLLKTDASLPDFWPMAAWSGESRQLWIARHRARPRRATPSLAQFQQLQRRGGCGSLFTHASPRFQRCLHPQDGHSSGNSMRVKESQKLRFPYPSQLARTLPTQGNESKYLALQSSIFADRSQIGLRAALAGIKGRGRPYFAPTTRARLRTEPQPAINQLRRSYGKRRISGYRLVRLSIFEFLPLRNGWAGPSKPPQDSGTRLAGMTTQVRRISLFCLANVPTPAKADPAKGSIR